MFMFMFMFMNIEVEGGFVIPPRGFCYTSRLKNRKSSEKRLFAHTLAALAKLSGCQNQPVLSKNQDNSLFFRS